MTLYLYSHTLNLLQVRYRSWYAYTQPEITAAALSPNLEVCILRNYSRSVYSVAMHSWEIRVPQRLLLFLSLRIFQFQMPAGTIETYTCLHNTVCKNGVTPPPLKYSQSIPLTKYKFAHVYCCWRAISISGALILLSRARDGSLLQLGQC